jgi:transcriptional regulator with XRE-family HTH domain
MQTEKLEIQRQVAEILHDVVTDFIRANRQHGMTQEALAERMQYQPGTLYSIINGHRSSSVEFMVDLMRATGDRRPLELIECLANLRPQQVTVKSAFESVCHAVQSTANATSCAVEALQDARVDSQELANCQHSITSAIADLNHTLGKLTSLHNSPQNVQRFTKLAETAVR